MRQQTFIKVNACFDETGYMLPEMIFWKNRAYPVDEVLYFHPADFLTGGSDDLVQCYTVKINGEEKHLFFEKVHSGCVPRYGKWFVLTGPQ